MRIDVQTPINKAEFLEWKNLFVTRILFQQLVDDIEHGRDCLEAGGDNLEIQDMIRGKLAAYRAILDFEPLLIEEDIND